MRAGGGGGHLKQVARIHHTQPEDVERGGPPKRQRELPAHGMQAREGGGGLNQDEEDGAPPEKRALPEHNMQGRGEGDPQTPKRPTGDPLSSMCFQRTACKQGKRGDP